MGTRSHKKGYTLLTQREKNMGDLRMLSVFGAKIKMLVIEPSAIT